MNYQASNPESLSETPERLSETKTRSDSAAKKRAAEVLPLQFYSVHKISFLMIDRGGGGGGGVHS